MTEANEAPEPNGSDSDASESLFQAIWGDLKRLPSLLYRSLKNVLYALTGADNDPDKHGYDPGAEDAIAIERIQSRAEALVRERSGLRIWRTLIVFGSAAVPIVFILLVPEWKATGVSSLDLVLGACLVFAELFLLVCLLFVRARVATLGAQLQILQYDTVLTSFAKGQERRAADLFFKHQVELKQYYDQTLRQNRQSFVLGVICIVFGLAAIVAVATLLLVQPGATTPAQIVAGGLGILLAVLTGFVAQVYLRVYEGSAEALGSFHDRLVNTNNYHFASLLISMIRPDSMRMDSLAELAKAASAPRAATELLATDGKD